MVEDDSAVSSEQAVTHGFPPHPWGDHAIMIHPGAGFQAHAGVSLPPSLPCDDYVPSLDAVTAKSWFCASAVLPGCGLLTGATAIGAPAAAAASATAPTPTAGRATALLLVLVRPGGGGTLSRGPPAGAGALVAFLVRAGFSSRCTASSRFGFWCHTISGSSAAFTKQRTSRLERRSCQQRWPAFMGLFRVRTGIPGQFAREEVRSPLQPAVSRSRGWRPGAAARPARVGLKATRR